MRNIKRREARAQRLLERARTIVVVGADARSRTLTDYLRGAGYDVVPVRSTGGEMGGLKVYPSIEDVPGQVDLVVVLASRTPVRRIVEQAAAKGADAVWLARASTTAEDRAAAQAAGIPLVADLGLIGEHRPRLREAGQPARLGVGSRRRGRGGGRVRDSGWTEAGGGGRAGGGGGRAAVDEKKMVDGRPSRRGRRRAVR